MTFYCTKTRNLRFLISGHCMKFFASMTLSTTPLPLLHWIVQRKRVILIDEITLDKIVQSHVIQTFSYSRNCQEGEKKMDKSSP